MGIRAYPAPDLAQLWVTCVASSNNEMMPPAGEPWAWTNLESQIPGRGGLRLHESALSILLPFSSLSSHLLVAYRSPGSPVVGILQFCKAVSCPFSLLLPEGATAGIHTSFYRWEVSPQRWQLVLLEGRRLCSGTVYQKLSPVMPGASVLSLVLLTLPASWLGWVL